MRTTLSIDDDVLTAAKALAVRRHKSLGKIISSLARQTLRAGIADGMVLPLRADAKPVTLTLVNQLRDELA